MKDEIKAWRSSSPNYLCILYKGNKNSGGIVSRARRIQNQSSSQLLSCRPLCVCVCECAPTHMCRINVSMVYDHWQNPLGRFWVKPQLSKFQIMNKFPFYSFSLAGCHRASYQLNTRYITGGGRGGCKFIHPTEQDFILSIFSPVPHDQTNYFPQRYTETSLSDPTSLKRPPLVPPSVLITSRKPDIKGGRLREVRLYFKLNLRTRDLNFSNRRN